MSIVVGPPGILIALEGIDGAGKTTQAALLAESLQKAGLGVVSTKEPTSGIWGQKIRKSAHSGRLSTNEELEAFINDRKEHVATVIKPALDKGEVVIVDRYYFSTAAYQGSRGLDQADILRQNEVFAPQPDLLVILNVQPTTGLKRIAERGDEANLFEREDELRKAAAIFAAIDKPYTIQIDGCDAIESIHYKILEHLYNGPLFQRLGTSAAMMMLERAS